MQISVPVRVERNYIQKLRGTPEEIFPLLCPVREKEWAQGWDPLAVYTSTGFAESGCIFTTGEEKPDSIWIITSFDASRWRMEIVKVTPGFTVGRFVIALSADGHGGTSADVTYTYTAISSEGESFVHGYTEEYFARFMQFSESALNAYLDAQREENGAS
ncbi:MAG: hypothetical protein LLG06_12470 [Desulfobacteraceae bacterium]|nr:hypothetical protein [Desulfobacteraceae bacterium]